MTFLRMLTCMIRLEQILCSWTGCAAGAPTPGTGKRLMEQYKERGQVKGRKKLILTCLPDKVEMYKKFGFKDHGIGDSVWGGEAWHEMDIVLEQSKISFFADLNLHSFDIIIKGIETNPETAGTFNFKEESYYDYLEQPGYS